MENKLKTYLIIAAVLLTVFGGCIGYYIGFQDSTSQAQIWTNNNCECGNPYPKTLVGGIIAGTNESDINMSQFQTLH